MPVQSEDTGRGYAHTKDVHAAYVMLSAHGAALVRSLLASLALCRKALAYLMH